MLWIGALNTIEIKIELTVILHSLALSLLKHPEKKPYLTVTKLSPNFNILSVTDIYIVPHYGAGACVFYRYAVLGLRCCLDQQSQSVWRTDKKWIFPFAKMPTPNPLSPLRSIN